MLEREDLRGSIYSAQPISVVPPIWRGDLLERVEGAYGSFDRTHHHPRFTGWELGRRTFVEELSTDPLAWVGARLSDLDTLLVEAGVAAADVGADDAAQLRETVPEILAAINACWTNRGRRPRTPSSRR